MVCRGNSLVCFATSRFNRLAPLYGRRVVQQTCSYVARRNTISQVDVNEFRKMDSIGQVERKRRERWKPTHKKYVEKMRDQRLLEEAMREEYDLSDNCASCGASLQSENPKGVGYYNKDALEGGKDEREETKESVFADERESMLLEQLRELDGDAPSFQEVSRTRRQTDPRLKCQRCLDWLHRTKTREGEQEIVTIEEVMKEVPKDATIVHVVSALDFPLGVDRRVLNGRNPKDVWWVINKMDAFFDKKNAIDRTGISYFADSLQRLVGADPTKVVGVSAKYGWKTSDLLDTLPKRKRLYFIGGVNTGKSSLVRTLIYRDDKSLRSTDAYGPGVSNLACFTRRACEFPLKSHRGTILVDTPGFCAEGGGIYQYLTPEGAKLVSGVSKHTRPEPESYRPKTPRTLGRKVFTGSSVLGIGGFVYLQPPADGVIKVFQMMAGEIFRAPSLERACEVSKTGGKSVGTRYLVKRDTVDSLVRYVIPPFYGKIDIVIGGVGFFSMFPVSQRNREDSYQVYVPRGVDVVIRESIFKYIYKVKENMDEKGNRISKSEMGRRGVSVLRKVPKDKAIFSKLMEVPMEPKRLGTVYAMGKEKIYGSQEEFPNVYWREPDLGEVAERSEATNNEGNDERSES